MKSFAIFATSSLFGALVNAAPVNKRDIFWVTETDIDIVTVPVTMTVWAPYNPQSTDEAFAHHSRSSASVTSTVTVVNSTSTHASVASSTTSTSVYVAATTTSVSEHVEPTTTTSTSEYVAPTTTSTSQVVEPSTTTTSEYVAPTTTSTSEYVAPTTSTTSTSVYVAPTTSTTSTSTSVYVAPTTTSTPVYVAPTTTSTTSTSTTSTSAAAATTTAASSGSGPAAAGTSYTGDLTWYDVGLGSCGITSSPSDAIVAVSHVIMDDADYYTANPNNNPLCGRKVSITGVSGAQYTATVVDRCVGCAEADLDLSEDFFNTVTENGDGRVHDITWTWL